MLMLSVVPVPVNATGAMGAVLSEMGIPWRIARGIGVLARAVGLVGHIREESEKVGENTLNQRLQSDDRSPQTTFHLQSNAISSTI